MIKFQNSINAPNTTIWTPFTTTITSTGTTPTPGVGSTITSYYMQDGKMLSINMLFYNAAVGSDGSGIYLMNIPSGFTINTTVAPVYDGTNLLGNLGNVFCKLIGYNDLGTGTAFVYDSTHYYLAMYGGNYVQAILFGVSPGGRFSMGGGYTYHVSVNILIPIN